MTVRIERGLAVPTSTARKYPSGTIFLDGAAQGEPFLDHERQIYNLDHHEGCIRAFTLSTCEQAIVMLLKGLDLRTRQWTIYANSPDLDTILAIWVLLNHIRINENEVIRKTIIPVLRLEGAIDSLGLEFKDLCGFPTDLYLKTMKDIDDLRFNEFTIKKEGRWEEIDFLEYTADTLRKIDLMIYQPGDFETFKGVEELASVKITDNRIGIVCRADIGIYELEQYLAKLYGNRLGLVVLQREPNTYSLRQIDLFLPGDLTKVYERLNFFDPAVNGRRPDNRWGGSADIGGSPRITGTKLTPLEIANACRKAFHKTSPIHYFLQLFAALIVSSGVLATGWATTMLWKPKSLFFAKILDTIIHPIFGFSIITTILTCILLIVFARKRYWTFGFRLPAGYDWWILLPVVILGGISGAAWVSPNSVSGSFISAQVFFALLLYPISAELLFRSLVHGILAQNSPIQHVAGRWFLSWPVLASSLLYAASSMFTFVPFFSPLQELWSKFSTMTLPIVAFAFSLSLGMVRERSQSIIPTILFHSITVAIIIYLYNGMH
ncbi:MAG: CPBP family glutamic-type intramembrane protease [Candidatus Dadabacteria bacterium]|nr:CPBP family glutamic-type intramembrane protease [Candidatus Dadabacteria bacterium]